MPTSTRLNILLIVASQLLLLAHRYYCHAPTNTSLTSPPPECDPSFNPLLIPLYYATDSWISVLRYLLGICPPFEVYDSILLVLRHKFEVDYIYWIWGAYLGMCYVILLQTWRRLEMEGEMVVNMLVKDFLTCAGVAVGVEWVILAGIMWRMGRRGREKATVVKI